MKMRKILLFGLLVFLSSWAKAQSGYKYLDLSGGYLFQPRNGFVGTLALEFTNADHGAYEFFVQGFVDRYRQQRSFMPDTVTKALVAETKSVYHQNYLAGIVIKPLILRSKNTTLRFRIGTGFGSNLTRFIVAPQAGFELAQAFSGGLELMVQQNNSYVLWDDQHWRSGLSVGIKFPFY